MPVVDLQVLNGGSVFESHGSKIKSYEVVGRVRILRCQNSRVLLLELLFSQFELIIRFNEDFAEKEYNLTRGFNYLKTVRRLNIERAFWIFVLKN